MAASSAGNEGFLESCQLGLVGKSGGLEAAQYSSRLGINKMRATSHGTRGERGTAQDAARQREMGSVVLTGGVSGTRGLWRPAVMWSLRGKGRRKETK